MFIFGILFVVGLVGIGVLVSLRQRRHRSGALRQALHLSLLRVLLPKVQPPGAETGAVPKADEIRTAIAVAENLFSSIGGLRAQRGWRAFWHGRTDHLSFEIVAQRGVISFYVVVPTALQRYVQEMILAQYPSAQLEEVGDYGLFAPNGVVRGCALTLTREYLFPLKTYVQMEGDPLNAITNSLRKLAERNTAAVQLVIRSARKEWHNWGAQVARDLQHGDGLATAISRHAPGFTFGKFFSFFSSRKPKQSSSQRELERTPQLTPMMQETIKAVEQKTSKAGLDVNIRLIVSSADGADAEQALRDLTESFNQFTAYQYGNSLRPRPMPRGELADAFLFRRYLPQFRLVLNAEEVASLYHFPTPFADTPNIEWLGAKKQAAPTTLPTTGVYLGENTYHGTTTPIYLKPDDRRRHVYVVGMTGTGKSTLIENLAIQDITSGHGVCVVDPHGSLVEGILAAVPRERAEDVILLDAADTARPLGLNIMEADTPQQQDLAIQELIAIFYKLVTDPSMIGPMFEHHMRNAMLTLMADREHPGTIVDIPRIFSDPGFQKYKLKFVTDPLVRNYWEHEVAKTSDFHKSEMLGYLISKVGRFVENALVRNIIGQPKSSFDLKTVMAERKILLVNLSKGKVGEINSALLGLILVSKLQMAALARADVAESQRPDFYLYIDEFQNFITDSISVILSEARKYRLNLTLAHQYLGQLVSGSGVEGKSGDSRVRDAVFGNVGTVVCFRVGVDDADLLAKQLGPGVTDQDLMNIEKYHAYIRLMVDNAAIPAFAMRTPPPVAGDAKVGAAIRELSRLKFGRPQRTVEAEIFANLKLGATTLAPQPPKGT